MEEIRNQAGEDAVVVGGNGDNARKCISAASGDVALKVLPEVQELAALLTGMADPSPEKPTQPENSGATSCDVAEKPDARGREKKTRGKKKAVLIAAAVFLVLLTGFGIYEYIKISSIMDSVNYVPDGLRFDKVDVLVSESCSAAATSIRTESPARTA